MSYRQNQLQRKKARGKTEKKPRRRSFFRRFLLFSFGAAMMGVLIVGLGVFYYLPSVPELEEIVDGRAGGSVTFLDQDGREFAWRGQQFEGRVTAANVSQNLKNAVIATEDKRFYRHIGISPRGIARAFWTNYQENGNPFRGQGGSTITTQVAKLICLGKPYDPATGTLAEYEAECRRSTVERKLREYLYAMALEVKFTKEEILTIYFNRAYMGAGTYGFGAASKRYFGIPASGLDVAQSAMLAGMLTAPSRFAPTNNLQRAQDRAATVVRLMYEQGFITEAERDEAMANPATLSQSAQSDLGIFFADWIMKSEPDFLTRDTQEDIIYLTTFDPQIQRDAERAVEKITSQFAASSRAEVAVVVMDRSGAVRAMVGGRFDEDKIEQGFNRATDAKRQPGSAFKPFVYGAALKAGMHPYDIFVDSEICVNVPGSGTWCPKNYSNNYRGAMTMIEAMQRSVNTIAVELAENSPREQVRQFARHLGITSELVDGPSLALGTTETSLLEMTAAYAGILNGTRTVVPYGWTQMGDKLDNTVIAMNAPQIGAPWMDEVKAGWLVYMMYNVVEQGTATGARVPGHQIAGKTGTTSEAKDALFIGFSADYVTGVWLGYDDNTPLKGTTGGDFPADIFRETMTAILARTSPKPLPMVIPQPKAPPPPTIPATPNIDTGDQFIDGLIELLLGG